MPLHRTLARLPWIAGGLWLVLQWQGAYTRPAAPPTLVPQTGHGSVITGIAFSPDGRTLATASEDRTILLWDLATGAVRRMLQGHASWVLCVAFSPDGRSLASGGEDDAVILWNAADGTIRRTLKGHRADVNGILFTPDGRWLISRSEDGTALLWDAATGVQKGSVSGAASRPALSPDGRTLAVGTRDHAILLWNVDAGKAERTLRGRDAPVAGLAYSPDGRMLASGDDYGSVTLWNVAEGKPVRVLKGHDDVVSSVCFSPDGRLIASGSSDAALLRDTATGQVRHALDGDARAVAFSPDGRLFAATDGATVSLRDVDSGKVRRVLQGQAREVLQVAVSPDGRTLAAGTRAGAVLWDLATAEARATLRGPSAGATCAAFSPDGRTLATGSEDHTVLVWDLATRKVQRTLAGHADTVTSVAYSPDGRALATGSADGTVVLRDAGSGEQLAALKGHTWPVTRVAFSPDGKTLASASWDTTVVLWDVEKRRVRRRLEGHGSWVYGLAFSPDGRLLASASRDGTLRLWDPVEGKAVATLSGHSAGVRAAAFSPDGKRLVTGDESGAVLLWDVEKRRVLRALRGHAGVVSGVVFRPDGRTVASGSWDGTVRLWDAASGSEVASALSLDEGLDWLIATPAGYYNASLNGGRLVRWRVGDALYPVERYARRFKKPDLVAQALQGKALPAGLPILSTETRPPSVALEAAGGRSEVQGGPVRVRIEAIPGTPDGSITRVELRINGRLADIHRATDVAVAAVKESGASPSVNALGTARSVRVRPRPVAENGLVVEASVALLPDEKEIRLVASAYDDQELRGDSEMVVVKCLHAPAPMAADCYVLAVGVSRYATPEYNLRFADADARELAAQFREQQGRVFRRVETKLIADAEATASRIRAGLEWLSERPAPGDTAVVLFSGHGVRGHLRKLYFFTHDGDLDALRDTCLSWQSVEESVRRCPARQVLVFMDCCHAGAFGERRASVDELAENLVDNVVVFASSRGSEESVEHPDWGHGAFTRAVLDGLRGAADFEGTGVVTAGGLVRYLPGRVEALTGDRQHPIVPRPEELDAGLRLAQAGETAAAWNGASVRLTCQGSSHPPVRGSLTDGPEQAILHPRMR